MTPETQTWLFPDHDGRVEEEWLEFISATRAALGSSWWTTREALGAAGPDHLKDVLGGSSHPSLSLGKLLGKRLGSWTGGWVVERKGRPNASLKYRLRTLDEVLEEGGVS